MDLSKVPQSGFIQLSSGFIKFYRKDNVIHVPVERTVVLPVFSEDLGTTMKEVTFRTTAIAKCNPEDKFSLKYGVRKAYARGLEELLPKIEKAVRRNKAFTPDVFVSRELKQVKNELKAMEAKFEKARQLKLAE